MIQKISDPGRRIDTGVVQFGEDWPGTFVRGDNSAGIADLTRGLARMLLGNPSKRQLKAAAKFLNEYIVDLFDKCQIH